MHITLPASLSGNQPVANIEGGPHKALAASESAAPPALPAPDQTIYCRNPQVKRQYLSDNLSALGDDVHLCTTVGWRTAPERIEQPFLSGCARTGQPAV